MSTNDFTGDPSWRAPWIYEQSSNLVDRAIEDENKRRVFIMNREILYSDGNSTDMITVNENPNQKNGTICRLVLNSNFPAPDIEVHVYKPNVRNFAEQLSQRLVYGALLESKVHLDY
jgi:hypothetical protein